MTRTEAVAHFYGVLAELEARVGGARKLSDCNGRQNWPSHGVYFFFEPGEVRTTSGAGPRVVRVGTHALGTKSKATLWNRLAAHRGSSRGSSGNHRGSVFRLIVGDAALRRGGARVESWGVGQSVGRAVARLGIPRNEVRSNERATEQDVSRIIGSMSFVWISTSPAACDLRGAIERGAIALLSNYDREAVDPPTAGWLGRHSSRELVRASGLWNNEFVRDPWDPSFLARFERSALDTVAVPSKVIY